MAFKQTRKHEAWVWSFFFFIQSLKRKLWVFKEGFFQVIHFIVVADERASNRAVANVLRLSCLARDFLLSPFFFLFLPLALSFWYWCLQLHSWTAVHNSTDPSFSRVTQSARVRGHTRGDWFKVQIASERIQRRAGRKKSECLKASSAACQRCVSPLPWQIVSWDVSAGFTACTVTCPRCSLMYSVSPARITSTHLLNK